MVTYDSWTERTVAKQRSIGDSDEPLGRMLGTLRFWFTKDLVRAMVYHIRDGC